MTNKLSEALQNVETTYGELISISNDMTAELFAPANALISQIEVCLTSLPIDSIRDFLLRLQLEAFKLSEIKEKFALKASLADALQKEKFAVSFNMADGSAAVKDKVALLATSEETVSEALYNLVANLFKTKLDSIHRMIDTLKSILMSRMQEQKFMNIGAADDPDSYKTKAQIDEENSRRI